MSTYAKLFSNNPVNKYQPSSSLNSGHATFSYGAALAVIRTPEIGGGASSYNILSSHDSANDGLRVYLQSGDIFAIWRTSDNNTAVRLVDNFEAGEIYVLGIHAIGGAQQQFSVNGELVGTPIDMTGATLRGAAAMTPFIAGHLTIDVEVADFAYWVSNTEAEIPTIEEILAYRAGQSMPSATASRKIHLKAVGTESGFVSQFTDQFGSNHAIHIGGDLDDTNSSRPIFVVNADPSSDFSVTPSSTARTLTLSGYSAAEGGAAYYVIDTAENLNSAPEPEDVAAGLLNDGETSAAWSGSIDLSSSTVISVLEDGVPADTELAYAIVHDMDGEGDYSEVLYGTISTKRPVVIPAGENKKWYAASGALLASESGIELTVIGTEYSENDLATNESAEAEINLTAYVNTGVELDVGDTVDIILTRSNGERLALIEAEITAGEG